MFWYFRISIWCICFLLNLRLVIALKNATSSLHLVQLQILIHLRKRLLLLKHKQLLLLLHRDIHRLRYKPKSNGYSYWKVIHWLLLSMHWHLHHRSSWLYLNRFAARLKNVKGSLSLSLLYFGRIWNFSRSNSAIKWKEIIIDTICVLSELCVAHHIFCSW